MGWRKALLYRDLNYQKLQHLSYILFENHGEDRRTERERGSFVSVIKCFGQGLKHITAAHSQPARTSYMALPNQGARNVLCHVQEVEINDS